MNPLEQVKRATSRRRGRIFGAAAIAAATALALAALTGLAGFGGSGSGDSASADPSGTALSVSHGAGDLEQQMVRVVKAVSPAVVQIQTTRDLGSGIVLDNHGDVVTNAHVVNGATRFVVT